MRASREDCAGGKAFLHEVHLMGRTQAAIGRITGKGGFYSTFAQRGRSLECKAYRCIRWRTTMDQPTFDPTHRANGAAAHRVGASAVRRASRGVSVCSRVLRGERRLWVAGGIVLLPHCNASPGAGCRRADRDSRSGRKESGRARRSRRADAGGAGQTRGLRRDAGRRHRAVADAGAGRARRRSVHARRQRERLDRHSGRGRTAGRAAR